MATKKNQPVPVSKNEVALPFDYSGFEGPTLEIGMGDIDVPFISLVQSSSKCIDEEEEQFIPGGAAGQILNAGTREYSDRLLLVACNGPSDFHSYVEWLPDRAGFAGEHTRHSDVVINAVKDGDGVLRRADNGNELVETKSLWCIIVDEEFNPVGYCLVPFNSSKFRPFRTYWGKIKHLKNSPRIPPMAFVFALGSRLERNKRGDKFYNYTMFPAKNSAGELAESLDDGSLEKSALPMDHPAFLAAVELRKAIDSGRAKADHETQETGDRHF
jgi:hypothetical protein